MKVWELREALEQLRPDDDMVVIVARYAKERERVRRQLNSVDIGAAGGAMAKGRCLVLEAGLRID